MTDHSVVSLDDSLMLLRLYEGSYTKVPDGSGFSLIFFFGEQQP